MSITAMPTFPRDSSSILLRFALGLTAVAAIGSTPAWGAARAEDPVSVIAVAPSREDTALKALLSNDVGSAAASTPVRRPEGQPAAIAQSLSARASAARTYGDIRVSAFRMADESLAYALLRFLRPQEAVATDRGDDGWVSAKQTTVRLGDVVIHTEGGTDSERSALCDALVVSLGRPAPNAPIVDDLPSEGRIASSVRYVSSLEMLRRFRPDLESDVYRLGAGGADAVVAEYSQEGATPARLLIVEYQTPQLAAEAERSVTAWFEGLDPAIRSTRVLKREGNFLIEATDVSNPEAFRRTVDAVKYDYQIKMLQGADPTVGLDARKEAYTTAMLLLGSVRLVGAGVLLAIMIGMTIGTIVFMRRRRAAANIFSDAGGMVHLQLEAPTPMLEPRREPRALLPDRSES